MQKTKTFKLLRTALLSSVFTFACSVAVAQQAPSPTTADLPLIEYDSIEHPVSARHGMVASQNALATEIGVEILEQGGNAVDAAVAVGFALAVTLPRAGNISGGGFMLAYIAEEDKYIALDYKEMAPGAAHRNMYLLPDGSVDEHAIRSTRAGFGIPGTVAAFDLAVKKYGTMTLKELVKPAIKLAKEGIRVTDDMAYSLKRSTKRLSQEPAAMKVFLDDNGVALRSGDTLIQSDLAWSLEQIAKNGADAFYKGAIAKKLVADMQANGGIVTMEDLANYKVAEREPLRGTYRGKEIIIMPPPSSGGVHILQMFNVFEHYDIESMGHNSAATIHLMSEAMRQAYADRSKHLGDPDVNDIPVEWLTSEAYAEQTIAAIPADKARLSSEVNPGTPRRPESPDTTHYSVMDKFGNVVSNTYSLNYSYGSGLMVPGTGILLNNGMDDFSAKPGSPNGYGLVGGEANAISSYKRSLSSMTPVIVAANGKPFMATGSPGGSRIITSVMQVLMNVIDHKMNLAEATHAPRIHHQWLPDKVYLEPGISPDTRAILSTMGHSIESTPFTMGSTQSVEYKDGFFYGAADPRRPGAEALGY
ncbi:gamma-glutamyltransferase [Alteromonas lipolytica]|uniref:Glutathione hydrolase proenzyme n=1 Tax=Alteromonas lipolytica TaxID=1856405 RepID=A0A1E8FCF0_9ALTE|nr:gamma-glutamyltransferase [Alteromonas lipolytica]OFI33288.1 gamma-glutamyltransferase [Alteromonas lipolytica]GGF60992.1 gamma-glutamyltransferase [Alteromonas lipolytica]